MTTLEEAFKDPDACASSPHRFSFNQSGMWLVHLGVLKATEVIILMFGIRDWELLICKGMELSARCTKCRTMYVVCHQRVEDGKEEENISVY